MIDISTTTERTITITMSDMDALKLLKELDACTDWLLAGDNLADLNYQLRDFVRGFFDDAPALTPVWEDVIHVGEVTYKEREE